MVAEESEVSFSSLNPLPFCCPHRTLYLCEICFLFPGEFSVGRSTFKWCKGDHELMKTTCADKVKRGKLENKGMQFFVRQQPCHKPKKTRTTKWWKSCKSRTTCQSWKSEWREESTSRCYREKEKESESIPNDWSTGKRNIPLKDVVEE